MRAQLLKCSRVLVVCDREGAVNTAMVSGTGLIGGSPFTRMRQVPAASMNTICPFGVVDKCLQPTTSV